MLTDNRNLLLNILLHVGVSHTPSRDFLSSAKVALISTRISQMADPLKKIQQTSIIVVFQSVDQDSRFDCYNRHDLQGSGGSSTSALLTLSFSGYTIAKNLLLTTLAPFNDP